WRVLKAVPSIVTEKTVPKLELPPREVVPYRVLPDKVSAADGLAPSPPPVKLCSVVKAVPSIPTLKTVPLAEVPPAKVVPNNVSPDKISPAIGLAPSLLVEPVK